MWTTAQIEDKPISAAEKERDRLAGLARMEQHMQKQRRKTPSRVIDKMVDKVEDIVVQLQQQAELEFLLNYEGSDNG